MCIWEQALELPQLPEMVFPRNSLVVAFEDIEGAWIEFNALDALKGVNASTLPNVQVTLGLGYSLGCAISSLARGANGYARVAEFGETFRLDIHYRLCRNTRWSKGWVG